MNVFKQLAFLSLLFLSSFLSAQNFGDALRYSDFDPVGTARFTGAGGAMGPIGADFSVLSTNPAGLAWIQKSEFMISPGLYISSANSRLVNGSNNPAFDDAAVQFNLPNIGIVTSSRRSNGMENFNFGIGLNRLADFNQQFYYEGLSSGTIVQRFEELANDRGLDDFEAGVAFDAGALIPDNGAYISDYTLDPDGGEILRAETVVRSGALNELSFGFAGNLENRILWGLSVGVPFLKYSEEKEYTETDQNGQVDVFDDLRYTQQLTTDGAGINLKLGFIYRPHQALRFSAAVHTPTYYQISEIYETTMDYGYTLPGESPVDGSAASPEGQFNYNLRTPWRLLGGVGTIFGKSGFLTGEVEYVNYGKNRFLFDNFSSDEAEINQETQDNLSSAVKIRTGAEYVMGNFRLRGGVGLQQAPIVGDNTFYPTGSFGLGLRQKSYYLDFAYRRTGQKTTYTPYLTADATQQFVDNDTVRENFVFTLGFRW